MSKDREFFQGAVYYSILIYRFGWYQNRDYGYFNGTTVLPAATIWIYKC